LKKAETSQFLPTKRERDTYNIEYDKGKQRKTKGARNHGFGESWKKHREVEKYDGVGFRKKGKMFGDGKGV